MGRTRGREAPSGPLLPGAGRASLRGRGRASASCPRPGPGAARARCQGHPRAKGLGHGGLHDLQPGGGRAEGQRPPRLAGFHRGEGSGRSGAGVGRVGAEAGPGRLGSWSRSLPGKRRREERPSQPAAAVLPCPAAGLAALRSRLVRGPPAAAALAGDKSSLRGCCPFLSSAPVPCLARKSPCFHRRHLAPRRGRAVPAKLFFQLAPRQPLLLLPVDAIRGCGLVFGCGSPGQR